MAELLGTRYFDISLEANEVHSRALDLSMLPDQHVQAGSEFNRALGIVSDEPLTPDSKLQTARILRDHGFNAVRWAIDENDAGIMVKAGATLLLEHSINITQALLDDMQSAQVRGDDLKLWELKTEHAETLSVNYRRLDVLRFVFGQQVADVPAGYEEAHKMGLAMGSNGYYCVSNALVAARHERLAGHPLSMMRWLGRASIGTLWTLGLDRRNARSAVLTMGNRLRDPLLSRRAALDSVRRRP